MTKAELAQALGISASMVSRLAKRGMPTDCVDRAKRWRRRHIETGRMKGVRYDPKTAAMQQQATLHAAAVVGAQNSGPHLRESLGLLEEALGDTALLLHENEASIATLLDGLRGRFLCLVVGRCGGIDAARLMWWHWCSLLPSEPADDAALCEHMDASCSSPVTLAEFHQALEPVSPITLEQLRAAYVLLM